MEVAVTTDVGSGQRCNDDAWCHEQLHRNVTLLAVADGFGRPQDVPSAAIVLDAIRDVIRRELRRATFPPRSLTANDMRELLVSAFAEGNERLLRLGGATEDLVSACSTCTLALVVSNQAFIAHIGDSRAYLLRRGELVQLTSDESLFPEYVRSGAPQQAGPARKSFGPALLPQALGVEQASALKTKIAHYTLHSHDALMLCTDGASRVLGSAELQNAAMTRESARAAAERVVAAARASGSTDNATVILARNATVHGPPVETVTLSTIPPWRALTAFAAAVVLFFITGAVARNFWFGDGHLYLAADSSGDVGLFAGSPDTFMGLPLHIERAPYTLEVSSLTVAEQREVDSGLPVSTPTAANAVVAKWQAQSRH